jgi:hypothetical protein
MDEENPVRRLKGAGILVAEAGPVKAEGMRS